MDLVQVGVAEPGLVPALPHRLQMLGPHGLLQVSAHDGVHGVSDAWEHRQTYVGEPCIQ